MPSLAVKPFKGRQTSTLRAERFSSLAPRLSTLSNRRRFLQTSAAAISGLALSGCGWKLAEVKARQTTQGSDNKKLLYIYTWAGYTDDALLKRFADETGIKAVIDVFGASEEMLAKIQGSGGGDYSIVYPSDYIVSKMVEQNLVSELDRSRLIGLENLFPRFQNPSADPGLGYSVPLSWGTTCLIYNAEKLKQPPEDWSYLWEHKQELSRKMTLLDDMREVMGATLKMLGYSYNSTDPKQLKQAYDKLVQLKPAIATFTTDAWQTRILAGDLLLAMCFTSDAIKVMRKSDKLQYVIPRSGSSVWMDTLAIPKTALNPDGAYTWINFMLKPEIAAQICERLSFATPNQAAFNLLPPPIRNNAGLFPPQALLAKCESITPLEDKITELYESYWTRLKSS